MNEAEMHRLISIAERVETIVGKKAIRRMSEDHSCVRSGEVVFQRVRPALMAAVDSMDRAEYGEIATFGRPYSILVTSVPWLDTVGPIVGVTGYDEVLPRSEPNLLARFQRSIACNAGHETVKDMAVLTMACIVFDLVKQHLYCEAVGPVSAA